VSGLKLSPLAVACGVFVGSILTLSSVAQATDLQIYAKPDAGQKTIVLMLDTSGSMDYKSAEIDYNDCNMGIMRKPNHIAHLRFTIVQAKAMVEETKDMEEFIDYKLVCSHY
jgi:Mg-chelatase subunit ChlD